MLIKEKYDHIEVNKIFIMGDFNDPYNVLKGIKLSEKGNLVYKGSAPKSCCYNVNSSGITSKNKEFNQRSEVIATIKIQIMIL